MADLGDPQTSRWVIFSADQRCLFTVKVLLAMLVWGATLLSVHPHECTPEAVSDVDWRVKSRIQHSEIGGGERGTHHGKCYTGVYIWMCLVRVVALLSHMLYVCMRERKYVYWPYLNNWLPSLLGLSAHHVYTSIYPSFSLSLTHKHTHTHTHTQTYVV